MRQYTDEILDEIKRELAIIWTAQRQHRLDGKMRIFSPDTQKFWKSHEKGYELWFGPNEIDKAINKIKIFYKNGKLPNSPFLLDPVVYKQDNENNWIPVGSGVIWGTVLCNEDEEIPSKALKRIKDMRIFVGKLQHKNNENAGLKMLGFLKKPILPMSEELPPNGSIVPGCQSLIDLVNVKNDPFFTRHYLLSGLEYRMSHGTYQHPCFEDMFGKKQIRSARDIDNYTLHLQYIRDAAVCWNAYGRNEVIYERYGVDSSNLKQNLKNMRESDTSISEISKELSLIWRSHERHGLKGKMRLYSVPNQDNWRSKEPGVEIWFGPNDMENILPKMQLYYNAGLLPNTPLLLDPIVYREDEGGSYTPIGTSIVWSTALNVGLGVFNEEGLARIKDTNVFTGEFIRAGTDVSGIKIIGFLDAPYLLSEEEIQVHKKLHNDDNDDEKVDEEEDDFGIEELEEVKEAIIKDEDEDEDDEEEEEDNDIIEEEEEVRIGLDALSIAGCQELFNITGANGVNYYKYYLLTGMEYLCTNGAFNNEAMAMEITKDQHNHDTIIKKYTVSLQKILDGSTCWDSYDKLHNLWGRFGIDVKNLETNLRYFNLCGRDLDLLDCTGDSRDDADDKFEFFVNGWIPKAAITIIGATGGTGKSSLAHRLAVLASIDWKEDEPNPIWLGSEIDKKECRGLAIYFSGEDSAAIVNARAKMFDPEERSNRLMLFCGTDIFPNKEDGSEGDISDLLKKLHKLPDVSIVVIDPARKYLVGDEDDSDVVSQFFEAIEEFSIKKNCAMVIVHHLAKLSHPRDTRDILDLLRGSQVFVDRARVVIGLMREREKTIAGLAKNNIPPKLGMVEGERLFVRDPAALDLFWLPGKEGVRTFDVTEEELEQLKEEREAAAESEATESEGEK